MFGSCSCRLHDDIYIGHSVIPRRRAGIMAPMRVCCLRHSLERARPDVQVLAALPPCDRGPRRATPARRRGPGARQHGRAGPPPALRLGGPESVQQQRVHPEAPRGGVVLAQAVADVERLAPRAPRPRRPPAAALPRRSSGTASPRRRRPRTPRSPTPSDPYFIWVYLLFGNTFRTYAIGHCQCKHAWSGRG